MKRFLLLIALAVAAWSLANGQTGKTDVSKLQTSAQTGGAIVENTIKKVVGFCQDFPKVQRLHALFLFRARIGEHFVNQQAL